MNYIEEQLKEFDKMFEVEQVRFEIANEPGTFASFPKDLDDIPSHEEIKAFLTQSLEGMKEQSRPQGYSNWLTEGEKYGYLDYYKEVHNAKSVQRCDGSCRNNGSRMWGGTSNNHRRIARFSNCANSRCCVNSLFGKEEKMIIWYGVGYGKCDVCGQKTYHKEGVDKSKDPNEVVRVCIDCGAIKDLGDA